MLIIYLLEGLLPDSIAQGPVSVSVAPPGKILFRSPDYSLLVFAQLL